MGPTRPPRSPRDHPLPVGLPTGLPQVEGKMYYYTPSAIELEEADPAEWTRASADLNNASRRRSKKKSPRGKDKATGKKRSGDDSEGECPSETDSLKSLSKRTRGLFQESAAWGARS